MDKARRYRMRDGTPPPPRKKSSEFAGHIEERSLATPQPASWSAVPPHDDRDIAALKALRHGNATGDQQQRALEWIISFACITYGETFSPDPVISAHLQGRRFAGRQIVNVLNSRTRNQDESEHG